MIDALNGIVSRHGRWGLAHVIARKHADHTSLRRQAATREHRAMIDAIRKQDNAELARPLGTNRGDALAGQRRGIKRARLVARS